MSAVAGLNNERDLLLRAREILAGGWTQDVSARNAIGEPVSWSAPSARCFCASGALARACDDPNASPAAWRAPYAVAFARLTDVLRKRGAQSSVQKFNDAPERSIADVLALFDAAIEECAQ